MSTSEETKEDHSICDQASDNVNANDDAATPSNAGGDSINTDLHVPNDDNEEMVDIPVNQTDYGVHLAGLTQGPGNIVTTRNADLSERMQNFKSWGVSKILWTRQKVKEKLSRTSRTVDLGLEDRIGVLRAQKLQYSMLVAHNRRVIDQLRQLILVHQCAGRVNADLSQTERALAENFLIQSQMDIAAAALIKELIVKLTGSNETLETLVNKTYDDLLATIDNYEHARVEFDAYKTEAVRLVTQIQQQKRETNAGDEARLRDMQDSLEQRRIKYECTKDNVQVKIDLLEDHKNRVVQREMLNCRHAWFKYYSQCSDLLCPDTKSLSQVENGSEGTDHS